MDLITMIDVEQFSFIYLLLIWMIILLRILQKILGKAWLLNVSQLYLQIKNSRERKVKF